LQEVVSFVLQITVSN